MLDPKELQALLAEKQAVLFDMDGTLVDSNDLHAAAWAETLNKFGYQVPVEKVRVLIGMGGDKLLPKLTGVDAESAEGKEISEARTQIFKDAYAPKIRAFSRAAELLALLREMGKKIIIATSASKEELAAILQASGLEGCFPQMTSADDAEESKPDPDIIQAALRKVGVSAGAAILIGDTPYDVEAGLRAGVTVIGVRSGGWETKDLKGALTVGDDPAELLDALQPWHSGQAGLDEAPFVNS